MKSKFILLLLGAIVVLSTAFTSTTDVPKTIGKIKVEIKDNLTGFITETIHFEYTSLKEKQKFKARIEKKYNIMFCGNCTSWRATDDFSGICEKLCCVPSGYGLMCWTETAECCALPPEEPGC